ncbi:hypothetical protein KUT57_14370 [Pseudomonas aeruginosa]|nr:hypothetical protein [Pseudomonas aeruginosa]
MSSTQHQLIEQCAIRLRGIVEALDNIHDSTQHRSPHRWSTDLDDVHSSAESLLAMIKCQTADQAAQLLASPPPKCATCGGTGMVDDGEITCSEGGIPYENGPIKCVTDCPDCKAQPSPVQPEGAPVIGCLCGMPMTEGHHSPDGCSSLEEFAPHLSAQAQAKQAERPEVVAYRTIGRHEKHQHPHCALNYYKQNAEDQAAHWRERGCEVSEDELMTVAQHDRIVGAVLRQKHEADTALAWATRHYQTVEQQRDAALARVDALAVQVLKLGGTISFAHYPAAQAGQVPEVSGIGRDTGHPRAVVLYLHKEPTDDDLRAIQDGLRSLAAAPQPAGGE